MVDNASNTTLFETGSAPTTSIIQTDDSAVAILVGEGRKYASVDQLAKAYVEIDGFTETLKGENASLREQLTKATTLDAVLERLNSKEVKPSDQTPQSAPDIAKIVKETMTGMETAKTRQTNLQRADAKMKELFGDKAGEIFATQASTPELKQALTNLASVDPEKFVAIFHKGSTAPQVGFVAANTGGHNPGFVPRNDANDPSTKAYYDAMRKTPEGRKKYYSQDTQLAMHNAAQANPDKFWGRK